MNKIVAFTGLRYNSGHERCGLDVFRPADNVNAPLVILVHGGGWSGGNRLQYHQAGIALAERGIAAATIGYRLVPDAVWPEIFYDVARGVEHLCGHADELGIDTSKAVTWGSSAGAQLSIMLQLKRDELINNNIVAQLPDIVGTVSISTAILHKSTEEVGKKERREILLNGHPLEEISPYYQDPKTYKSILVIHSSKDELISVKVAESFVEKIKSSGADVRYKLFEGPGHGFSYNLGSTAAFQAMELGADYVKELI